MPIIIPVVSASGAQSTVTLTDPQVAGSTLPPIAVKPLVPGSGSTAGLRSLTQWESIFNSRAAVDDSNVYSGLSTSVDSWDYYNLAFGVDAFTLMWRATGKTTYLDKALTYIDNVLDRAKVSTALGTGAYRDSYMGWISQRSDVRGEEVPLFESFLWRYVIELAWLMKQTPSVYNTPTYRSQYDRILAFTEVHMFDKWYNRGDGPGGGGGAGRPHFYRVNAHMTSHWAFISLLISLLTFNSTRQSRAVAFYTDFNVRMRDQMIDMGFSWVWNQTWTSSKTIVNPGDIADSPHASGVVSYIIRAYELGTYWTDSDIAKLSHTLTDLIWRANGTYAMNIDGSGSGNGVIFDGFMKLGRYHPNIQRRVENYTGAKADNYGAVSTHNAVGALNARYLLS